MFYRILLMKSKRQLMDNIGYIDILEYLAQHHEKQLALIFDEEKAFDNLNWRGFFGR